MRHGGTGIMALWAVVSLLTVAPEASAYLDPSTGSMILSAIVGLFATAALAVKTYWYRLKSILRRDKRSPGIPAERPPQEPTTAPGD